MSNEAKSTVELDELGLQKRRYEIEPAVDGKAGQRLAIGMVLANSFLLIKNVLFGDSPAHTAPLPAAVGTRGADPAQNVHDGQGEGPARRAESEGDAEQPEDSQEVEAPVGSGTLLGIFLSAYEYDPGDGPVLRRPGSSNAGNDNEALYLAKPGQAIGLALEGHGSGGTGGSDGGDDDDGSADHDDDDDVVDRDDDGDDGASDDGDDAGNPSPGGDNDDDGDLGGSGGDGGGSGSPGSGGEDDVDGDEGDGPDEDVPDVVGGGPGSPAETRTNRLPYVSSSIVLAAILANEAATIAEASLLVGAADADGDALFVTNLTASSGVIVRRADGSWVFTPDKDDTSDVVFTYAISDGKGSIVQTASMDILPPGVVVDGSGRIIGTPGPDLLIGTPHDDWIDGLAGDDDIVGREGDDTIHGGAGNDRIVAGDGNDVVFAGDGDDVVFAGSGNDIVFAGNGADVVFGEEGNDTLVGEDGDDVLVAGSGVDIVDGGNGDDRLQGDDGQDTLIGGLGDDDIDAGADNDTVSAGAGNDVVSAGNGDDKVFGEAGNDVISAGDGNDEVDAGEGDDTLLASPGDDTYDGSEGFDTFSLSSASADAVVDLEAGTASSAEIGSDAIASIEAVVGGAGNDTITGDGNDNKLEGGGGSDAISDGGGNDIVDAGAGDDMVYAAAGDDSYDGGEGADTFSLASTAADAVIDLVAGTASSFEIGSDTLVHFEIIKGGRGRDLIIASTAVETLDGGESEDIFVFSSSASAGRGFGARDRIIDFEVGDRIDLDDISKEFEHVFDETFVDHGIRKFVIIDQHITFSKPGELKFKYDPTDDHTVLAGNIDRTPDAEFEIELSGNYSFTDSDFNWRT